jgi:hypothetical protein
VGEKDDEFHVDLSTSFHRPIRSVPQPFLVQHFYTAFQIAPVRGPKHIIIGKSFVIHDHVPAHGGVTRSIDFVTQVFRKTTKKK